MIVVDNDAICAAIMTSLRGHPLHPSSPLRSAVAGAKEYACRNSFFKAIQAVALGPNMNFRLLRRREAPSFSEQREAACGIIPSWLLPRSHQRARNRPTGSTTATPTPSAPTFSSASPVPTAARSDAWWRCSSATSCLRSTSPTTRWPSRTCATWWADAPQAENEVKIACLPRAPGALMNFHLRSTGTSRSFHYRKPRLLTSAACWSRCRCRRSRTTPSDAFLQRLGCDRGRDRQPRLPHVPVRELSPAWQAVQGCSRRSGARLPATPPRSPASPSGDRTPGSVSGTRPT